MADFFLIPAPELCIRASLYLKKIQYKFNCKYFINTNFYEFMEQMDLYPFEYA